jgi:hypothetical protein
VGALLVAAFIFVEESLYFRDPANPQIDTDSKGEMSVEKSDDSNHLETSSFPQVPLRKTWYQQMKPWSAYDPDVNLLTTMVRPFTYLLVPVVVWVILVYGLCFLYFLLAGWQLVLPPESGLEIGIAAFSFNYVFPVLVRFFCLPVAISHPWNCHDEQITQPPYNWPSTNSGLGAAASFVGYGLAVPFTGTSDLLAARLTRKNNMIREAEMRLPVLFPVVLLGPAGLICFGLTAQYQAHWYNAITSFDIDIYIHPERMFLFSQDGIFRWDRIAKLRGIFILVRSDQLRVYPWARLTLVSFFSCSTFVLAYAVDSYNANTAEMLIIMNLGKQVSPALIISSRRAAVANVLYINLQQAISFGLSLHILQWILENGYAKMIAGAFCAVLFFVHVLVVPFYIFGKRIRIWTSKSKLAELHRRSVKNPGETHWSASELSGGWRNEEEKNVPFPFLACIQ